MEACPVVQQMHVEFGWTFTGSRTTFVLLSLCQGTEGVLDHVVTALTLWWRHLAASDRTMFG